MPNPLLGKFELPMTVVDSEGCIAMGLRYQKFWGQRICECFLWAILGPGRRQGHCEVTVSQQ